MVRFQLRYLIVLQLRPLILAKTISFGGIPKEIDGLKLLSVLNLSHNRLSGHIPNEICNMSPLMTLDLSYNTFVRRIPSGGMCSLFIDSSFAGNPDLCSPSILSCPDIISPIQGSGQTRGKFCSPVFVVAVVVFVTVLLLVPSQSKTCEFKGGVGIIHRGKATSELKDVLSSFIPTRPPNNHESLIKNK